jgi:hypothetical protein
MLHACLFCMYVAPMQKTCKVQGESFKHKFNLREHFKHHFFSKFATTYLTSFANSFPHCTSGQGLYNTFFSCFFVSSYITRFICNHTSCGRSEGFGLMIILKVMKCSLLLMIIDKQKLLQSTNNSLHWMEEETQ